MALYPAIAATSGAMLALLRDGVAGGEFEGVEFAHYRASDFEAPMTQGFSLYLYRVTINANRNLPPQLAPDGTTRRPPIPLDLHFLVTAWAEDAMRQQRMLGFAVRTLENAPILPSGLLNQQTPEGDVFRPEETVELYYEGLSVQDMAYIWDVAQTKEQPSAPYAARMVEIESAVSVAEGAPVVTREFDFRVDANA
jgi:hypothetical protein